MAIEILLNGEPERVEEGATLSDLLMTLDVDAETGQGIAVAVNDEVVRRYEWAERELRSGDEVDIVTALQGG